MSRTSESLYFGPYRLVRRLADSAIAERWLALHERKLSSHVVHRFPACPDKSSQRRVLQAIECGLPLIGPHLLPIELFSISIAQRPCAVTPYTGNHEGLVDLDALLEAKRGRMAPPEAERAMRHLLEASRFAGTHGLVNGAILPKEVMVDRHGSCSIEFYGLRRRLDPNSGGVRSEVRRDEVRSILELGYRMITGLTSDEPRIAPSRLVKRLDRSWDELFEEGLSATGGFETPDDAIDALPSSTRDRERQTQVGAVRVVLNKFRWTGPQRTS